MKIDLRPYQREAVDNMKNGSLLCGGVGSGKSRTSLAYYYKEQGGDLDKGTRMKKPKDLYIITTARKRDTLEWEDEMCHFLMSKHPDVNPYDHNIVVDSWNNIKKYKKVYGAFFIFDEQRVVGSGVWVKSFLDIARKNQWVLLSATPGDTWSDYIPVFIANGFYRNRTHFTDEHAVWNRFSKYPKIDRFINQGKLIRLRKSILIKMDFERQTVSHHNNNWIPYDIDRYQRVMKDRWNPYKDEPVINAAELCYILRRVVNSDERRLEEVRNLIKIHPRTIIFYNFDYELEMLRTLSDEITVAEWNGHKHEPIPDTEKWAYLVQYAAGNEGWNCTRTDTVIFYSQNYSYKVMTQAAGRIDRMNTAYKDLYYEHLKSRARIDMAIAQALSKKKNFNEGKFAGDWDISERSLAA